MIPDEKYGIVIKTGTTLNGNILIKKYEQVPNIMEKHLIPRPIQIVYIESIEEPWRQLALDLERKYVALTLEMQNRKLNGYQKTENCQVTQNDVNQQCDEIEIEIEKLEQQLKQMDEDYNDKMKLLQQLQEQETRIESTSYDQEHQLEEMKQKFKKLNGLNSDLNEKIVMLEAENEAIKKMQTTRKSIVTTTSTKNQIHVL
ncbi:unnamed protein product [Paramecium primaurelia]|uniref:Uncharacterized protein n=2 Tax=Paramecium TaxID=5884 RepID=A0A8S1S7M9_9CILI|nr:unnamed protein product [Paramecium primaurelia]CAD8135059.1 unnamed protein product [Paramecium pentaurelia]